MAIRNKKAEEIAKKAIASWLNGMKEKLPVVLVVGTWEERVNDLAMYVVSDLIKAGLIEEKQS